MGGGGHVMCLSGVASCSGRFGAPAAAQKNDMFCGVGFLVFGMTAFCFG